MVWISTTSQSATSIYAHSTVIVEMVRSLSKKLEDVCEKAKHAKCPWLWSTSVWLYKPAAARGEEATSRLIHLFHLPILDDEVVQRFLKLVSDCKDPMWRQLSAQFHKMYTLPYIFMYYWNFAIIYIRCCTPHRHHGNYGYGPSSAFVRFVHLNPTLPSQTPGSSLKLPNNSRWLSHHIPPISLQPIFLSFAYTFLFIVSDL